MNLEETITSRRNIKMFKQDPVDYDLVLSWLELARMAPNHKMTEPWEIVFVGEETRARLNHKTNFGNAPMLFAVLSHRGTSEVMRDENMVAVACLIQNFNLLAWQSGIGTFWASLATSPAIRAKLAVTEEYDVVGLFGVGYPEVIPGVKERMPIEEMVTSLP